MHSSVTADWDQRDGRGSWSGEHTCPEYVDIQVLEYKDSQIGLGSLFILVSLPVEH